MFKNIILVISLFIVSQVQGQTISFSLELEKDTVQVGDFVTVTYVLTGARGDFQAPEFDNLRLVGGPNFSSQISIVQGQMDQTFTYSYIFQLEEAGDFQIPAASVNVKDEVFFSPSAELHVTANENWTKKKSAPTVPKKRRLAKDKNVTEI